MTSTQSISKQLNLVIISVKNLEESLRFYTNTIGLSHNPIEEFDNNEIKKLDMDIKYPVNLGAKEFIDEFSNSNAKYILMDSPLSNAKKYQPYGGAGKLWLDGIAYERRHTLIDQYLKKVISGSGGRIRTADPRLMSPVL